MVAPEATKRPVPMEPPMAIMDRCRALSSRLSAVGAAFLELSAAMDVSIGGSDPARPLAGAGAGMQNRKNKRAAVSRPALGDDVAGLVHLQVALEDLGIGRMADGDEAALQLDVLGMAVLGALDADAGHAGLVAQHLFEHEVGLELDLAGPDLVHELVHEDGLGLELVAAVHQGDLAGDVGQVQGFLDGRVAAADHAHGLLTGEETRSEEHTSELQSQSNLVCRLLLAKQTTTP